MTSRKDGNRRLLQAAKILRKVAPDQFDMEHIAHPCGTPACVLGHYAASSHTPFELKGRQLICGETDIGSTIDHPIIREHFALTSDECLELFDTIGCGRAETPVEAADYINLFVKAREEDDATST